tara:strand:+ start:69 stop:272 length:204 start_codon:yes stop_codon:yes gene_type:complete
MNKDIEKMGVVVNCTMIADKIGYKINIDHLLSDLTSLEEVRTLQDTMITEYNEAMTKTEPLTTNNTK